MPSKKVICHGVGGYGGADTVTGVGVVDGF